MDKVEGTNKKKSHMTLILCKSCKARLRAVSVAGLDDSEIKLDSPDKQTLTELEENNANCVPNGCSSHMAANCSPNGQDNMPRVSDIYCSQFQQQQQCFVSPPLPCAQSYFIKPEPSYSPPAAMCGTSYPPQPVPACYSQCQAPYAFGQQQMMVRCPSPDLPTQNGYAFATGTCGSCSPQGCQPTYEQPPRPRSPVNSRGFTSGTPGRNLHLSVSYTSRPGSSAPSFPPQPPHPQQQQQRQQWARRSSFYRDRNNACGSLTTTSEEADANVVDRESHNSDCLREMSSSAGHSSESTDVEISDTTSSDVLAITNRNFCAIDTELTHDNSAEVFKDLEDVHLSAVNQEAKDSQLALPSSGLEDEHQVGVEKIDFFLDDVDTDTRESRCNSNHLIHEPLKDLDVHVEDAVVHVQNDPEELVSINVNEQDCVIEEGQLLDENLEYREGATCTSDDITAVSDFTFDSAGQQVGASDNEEMPGFSDVLPEADVDENSESSDDGSEKNSTTSKSEVSDDERVANNEDFTSSGTESDTPNSDDGESNRGRASDTADDDEDKDKDIEDRKKTREWPPKRPYGSSLQRETASVIIKEINFKRVLSKYIELRSLKNRLGASLSMTSIETPVKGVEMNLHEHRSHLKYTIKEPVFIEGIRDIFTSGTSMEFAVNLAGEALQEMFNKRESIRAIAVRNRCVIQVQKRILNRKIKDGRWIKYFIVSIWGPNAHRIQCCDRRLRHSFSWYLTRKVYTSPAHATMFFNESTPDNTNLLDLSQRTGVSQPRFGFLRLNSGCCKSERVRNGKTARLRLGYSDIGTSVLNKVTCERFFDKRGHPSTSCAEFSIHVDGKRVFNPPPTDLRITIDNV